MTWIAWSDEPTEDPASVASSAETARPPLRGVFDDTSECPRPFARHEEIGLSFREVFCPSCARRFPTEETCPFHEVKLVPKITDFVPTRPWTAEGAVLEGKYLVFGLLGRGGQADVLLAENLDTSQTVAVKLLLKKFVKDDDARARFSREIEVAKVIDHPTIPSVVEVGERKDGTPWFAMEFLFGESLGDMLERTPQIDGDMALRIMKDVTSGLEAAHAAGVIHRDVKPDNVFLVGKQGDHHAVKLLDFGLARPQGSVLTRTGTVVGTVEYMAPEQCLSERVDPRTDVYGCGAVLFRATTGYSVVAGGSVEKRLAQQIYAPTHPVRTYQPSVSVAVERIVQKCLWKSRTRRWGSVSLLREAIVRALKDGTPPPPEPSGLDVYEPETPYAETVATVLKTYL